MEMQPAGDSVMNLIVLLSSSPPSSASRRQVRMTASETASTPFTSRRAATPRAAPTPSSASPSPVKLPATAPSRSPNLKEWGGLMGANRKYFDRNNLDVFSGRGPCLPGPPCWMELSSDGSGAGSRWYCNYVQVTATGPHTNCTQQLFTVEQWLARDRVPYQLTATRDYCSSSDAGRAMTKKVNRVGDAAAAVEQILSAGDV